MITILLIIVLPLLVVLAIYKLAYGKNLTVKQKKLWSRIGMILSVLVAIIMLLAAKGMNIEDKLKMKDPFPDDLTKN